MTTHTQKRREIRWVPRASVWIRESKLYQWQFAVVGLIGLATVLIMLLHLIFLTKYPPAFIDESWNANAAWTWLKTGDNFDTMHAGALDQFGYEWLRWPIIGNVVWLVPLAVGGLGLFQMRLASWAFGSILLLATFVVGRRSFGTMTGAVATLLLSLSAPFLQASHYGRPDIMIATVVMSAYALVQFAMERERWWAHFLAGLLIGLSLDIHPNGMFFAVGFGALYLTVYKSAVFQKRGSWLFGAGVLIGVGYFVIGHVLPNPDAYFASNRFLFGGTNRLPIQTGILASIAQELGRYHFYENGIDFALIGASILYLALRRHSADRRLLAFLGATFACFVLFVGNKHDVYAILFYPFLMIMVAETLISLIHALSDPAHLRVFPLALLVLLMVSSLFHFVRPVVSSRNYDYYAVTNQIRSVIPPGARVMGVPTWWLGLSDYEYVSSLSLTFYHMYNGYDLSKGLAAAHPQYVIVDSALRGLLADQGFPEGPGFEIYKLPRQEFENFLAERGTKIDEFVNPWHGTFDIYRIRWD